jgi:hypothetical protein
MPHFTIDATPEANKKLALSSPNVRGMAQVTAPL